MNEKGSSAAEGDEAGGALDAAFLAEWLKAQGEPAEGPLVYSRISGGRSNLTDLVEDSAGRRWILRRPPASAVSAAHNIAREGAFMAGLGATDIPVPRVIGLGQHAGGAQFLVMEFVPGHVLRFVDDVSTFSSEGRRTLAFEFIERLAAIHSVDPDAAGLANFRRGGDYVQRQLSRWFEQWTVHTTMELPAIEAVRDQLAARTPAEGTGRIVHGDYRLDNCVVGDDGRVRAILDWELAALGDPLVDLGLATIYWSGPGAIRAPSDVPLSSAEGFPTVDELVRHYASASGRDVSALSYYRAFAYWKMAIMIQGVFARHAAGAYGRMDPRLEHYPERVRLLAEAAQECLTA
jgi:aminoglycoside phosphotransferase (APT) family kinase protein